MVDERGRPVANTKVRILGERRMDPGYSFGGEPSWAWAHDIATSKTDAQGRFVFRNLYRGPFQVSAWHPEFSDQSVMKTAVSGGRELLIKLDGRRLRKVEISARVIDAMTEAPIDTFRVVPTLSSGWGKPDDFEAAKGRFAIAGLPRGGIEFEVTADGYAPANVKRDFQWGRHELTFLLHRRRSVEFHVVDEQGNPVPYKIEFLDTRGNKLTFGFGEVIARERKTVFKINRLPATRLTVRVTPLGCATSRDLPLDLLQEPVAPIRLVVGKLPAPFETMLFVRVHGKAATMITWKQDRAASPESGKVFMAKGTGNPASPVEVILRSNSGKVFTKATIKDMGPSEQVRTLRRFRVSTSYRIGTSAATQTGQEGPGRFPRVVLRGRSVPVSLEIKVKGCKPFVRVLKPREIAGKLLLVLLERDPD